MSDLDRTVAELEGWSLTATDTIFGPRVEWVRGDAAHVGEAPPSYTTDPRLWGPLIERLKLGLGFSESKQKWVAYRPRPGQFVDTTSAESLGEAICLAYVREFGDRRG